MFLYFAASDKGLVDTFPLLIRKEEGIRLIGFNSDVVIVMRSRNRPMTAVTRW